MSEKEKQMRMALQALAPSPVSHDLSEIVYAAIDELKESNHSLRMAVCEYFNNNSPELSNAIMLGAPFPNEARGGIKLALSAGIVFENGTWILKEGE